MPKKRVAQLIGNVGGAEEKAMPALMRSDILS
jgi:hypothetical protein